MEVLATGLVIRLNLYAGAGAGVGNPVSIGGNQRLWHATLSAENYTLQRAIAGAMPFIPFMRCAIIKSSAPQLGWLKSWNLANPTFEIPVYNSFSLGGGGGGGGGGGAGGGYPPSQGK